MGPLLECESGTIIVNENIDRRVQDGTTAVVCEVVKIRRPSAIINNHRTSGKDLGNRVHMPHRSQELEDRRKLPTCETLAKFFCDCGMAYFMMLDITVDEVFACHFNVARLEE